MTPFTCHRDAAARALRIWTDSAPASPDHPYLTRKQIAPGIARQSGASLVLPVVDFAGTLHGLQFIAEDGKKPGEESGPSPREEATEFLRDILADGPRMQREIRELADQDGISINTLKRAKKDLGIMSTKLADGWQWRLKNWIDGTQGTQETHISIYRKTGALESLDDGDHTESPQNQVISQEGQQCQPCHIPDDELTDGEV